MILKIKPKGDFGRWLAEKIVSNQIKVYDLAEGIRSSPKNVYKHLKGETIPSFPYLVAYCWYFNEFFFEENDPLDIWDNYLEEERNDQICKMAK